MGRGFSVGLQRGRSAGWLAVLVAASWCASASAALPSPEALVPNTVARISHVSDRMGTITKAEFRHALVLAAAVEDMQAPPQPGSAGYDWLERSAVDSLLEAAWIKGQAKEMGIVVTRRQVRREVAAIKEASFASGAEFRRFLRRFRYTRRDVYAQVELQVLSRRIQERIQTRIARESSTEAEEQRAFDEFLAEFNERWRSRTVCAPEYATDRCSNYSPPSR
jgi:SurA N-terminal domain